jgi:uncharacterized protein (UPF0332 family)
MTFKYADEIEANLARAQQSLEAAQELTSGEYYDFVASRAYYAAFYAATALLLSEELAFSKHSGVVASIHHKFVKTGRLDVQHGKNLNWLFELRNVGDYDGLVHVTEQDAKQAVRAASEFLEAINAFLEKGKGS